MSIEKKIKKENGENVNGEIKSQITAVNILNWIISLIEDRKAIDHIARQINKIIYLPAVEADSLFYNLFAQLEKHILTFMPEKYTQENLRGKIAAEFSSNPKAIHYITILQNEKWQIIKIQEELVTKIYQQLINVISSSKVQKIIDGAIKDTLLKGIKAEEERISFERAEQIFSKLPVEWLRLVINTFQTLIGELRNALMKAAKMDEKEGGESEKKIYSSVGEIYGIDAVYAAAAAKVASYSSAIATTKGKEDIITVTQKARYMIKNTGFDELITKGLVEDIETELIKKDGNSLPVKATASALKDKDGNIQGIVIVAKDMSRIKELEEIKTEFVSTASHQLRTPITGIQWVIERFLRKEEKNLSEKGKEYLNDLHTSTVRLSKLVDDLLNVSRIEGGKGINIAPEKTEVVSFIEKYLEETVPLRAKKNLTLNFTEHPLELKMITDHKLFSTIIESVISNAIEYTPQDGIIDITLKKKDTFAVIDVRDSGIGIPDKDQPKIFSKLYRADNAKTIKTDGTGLGLYIAKRATKLLEGKISFTSKVGKGTIFHIELPLESEAQTGEKTLL